MEGGVEEEDAIYIDESKLAKRDWADSDRSAGKVASQAGERER